MEIIISIVVPVYNTKDYLIRCIESILEQSFQDWELLLVDDGSTDESGSICDEYALKDNRIRVFHSENGGAATARNFGVSQACGEYVCFVDSDDSLPENSLTLLFENSNRNDYDITIGGYTRLFDNGDKNYCGFRDEEYIGDKFLYSLLSGNWKLSGPVAKLFKRSLFANEMPNIPKDIRVGEDLLMNVCLACRVKHVLLIPFSVYNYHQVASSATHTFKYSIQYIRLYLRLLENILKKEAVEGVEELLYHYKISIMYNVLLDDKNDNIDYKNECPRYNGILTKRLNFKEKLILYLIKHKVVRIGFRRFINSYRTGNGIVYRCFSPLLHIK